MATEAAKAETKDLAISRVVYENSSGAESVSEYRPKGYHPVQIGEVFNGHLKIIQKLGWGHFSTVWLVMHKKTQEYQAMKIIKSKETYLDAF